MGEFGLAGVPELLTRREVAELFGVGPKTVRRWETQDRLRELRTPGGEARYVRAEVEALRQSGIQVMSS